MDTAETIRLMAEIKANIISYLLEEVQINTNALKAYEEKDNPIQNSDPEVKRMREIEAIKLRDRIYELNRHIAVINRM
jgi:hypothetical protein